MICVAYTALKRLPAQTVHRSITPTNWIPHTHNLKAVACACIAPSLVNNVVP
eukprot:m.126786 g.126786  ORF g.126786 m.126786 type:complete len:52 (+) comp13843_c0_seq5:946-1101(+)